MAEPQDSGRETWIAHFGHASISPPVLVLVVHGTEAFVLSNYTYLVFYISSHASIYMYLSW